MDDGMSDDRSQRTEDRCRRSDVRGRRTDVRGRRTEVRGQRAEDRGQKTEDRYFRLRISECGILDKCSCLDEWLIMLMT
jgi:hypothetical protein